jgi:hypothetical protein
MDHSSIGRDEGGEGMGGGGGGREGGGREGEGGVKKEGGESKGRGDGSTVWSSFKFISPSVLSFLPHLISPSSSTLFPPFCTHPFIALSAPPFLWCAHPPPPLLSHLPTLTRTSPQRTFERAKVGHVFNSPVYGVSMPIEHAQSLNMNVSIHGSDIPK